MLPKLVQNRSGNTVMEASGTTIGEMPPDVIKSGYLRKLKTMKKKFFVLRCETDTGPARLEYYDNEKKWRLANVASVTGVPKRSIVLKTCFNINKKVDSKQKHAIALYTHDDCFAMGLDNDAELEEWLTLLLALQQGHTNVSGDFSLLDRESKPKPNFEHVWQVTVKSKGLGSSKSIAGQHRLCLTSTTLSLIKMNADTELFEFPLMSIRRCGHSDCFFFMELGRSACTGAGELWMQTEDTVIAQNMHEAILGAMKSSRSHEDLGPLARPRSSSTSENTKMIITRPVSVSNSQMTNSNSSVSTMSTQYFGMDRGVGVMAQSAGTLGPRDRCDSMPTRSRTVSEGHHDLMPRSSYCFEISRPHSIYSHSISYSPPVANNPLSPSSGAYSDSAGSSFSIDDFESPSDYYHNRYLGHPSECTVHTEPTITEESNYDYDYQSMTPKGLDNNDSGLAIDNQPLSICMHPEDDYLKVKIGANLTNKQNQRSSLTSMFLNLNTGSQDVPSNSSHSPISSNSGKTNQGGNSHMLGGGAILSGLSQVDSSKTSAGNNTSGYIEMISLSTSSLPDSIIEGYINMSPGTSININQESLKGNNSLEPDSQGSYAGSDWSDHSGYLPMDQSEENRFSNCQRHNDSQDYGYISMKMLSSSLPKSGYAMMGNAHVDLSSPSRSTNSLQDMSCSCSPAEMGGFHLDKVKSFFSPSEDDSDDYIKPARSYSIGSRPQVRKIHLGSHLDQHRVRAYSFGSQVHNNGSRVNDNNRTHRRNVASNSGYSGIDAELGTLRNLDSKVSKKSSSAPLLPSRPYNSGNIVYPNNAPLNNSLTPGIARVIRPSSCTVRNDHNEDLMEIVYQQPPPSSTSSTFSRVKGSSQDCSDHSRRFSSGSSRPKTNNRSSTTSSLATASPMVPTPSTHPQKEDNKLHLLTSNQDGNHSKGAAFDGGKVNSRHNEIKHKSTLQNALHRGVSLDSSKCLDQPAKPKDQASFHHPTIDTDYMERDPDVSVSNRKESGKKQAKPTNKTTNLSCLVEPEMSGYQFVSKAPASPNSVSGDYVSLDLSRATWQLNNLVSSSETPLVPTLQNVSDNPFVLHSYMNLRPPSENIKTTMSASSALPISNPAYSDYHLMSPVIVSIPANKHINSKDGSINTTTITTSANKVQGFSVVDKKADEDEALDTKMKRQMSTPTVPTETCAEPKPTGRKSTGSCQVTISSSKLPESPNHSLLLPSRSTLGSTQSIDRSSVSEELSESSTISGLSDYRGSPMTSLSNLVAAGKSPPDVAYENIQIGSSSSSPTSRPVSVSSERELNYASLDLAPPSCAANIEDEKAPQRSQRISKPLQANPTSSQFEENGNVEVHHAPLSYAEIDFTKSEGLRNVSGSLRDGRV